jgi:predicted ATPase
VDIEPKIRLLLSSDDIGLNKLTKPEHDLRGVAQPIAVYRVLGDSGIQSRLDIVAARGLTPLVGRESEVTLLVERWEQVKDGNGQVMLLSGEAGIGKSRLVQVLKDHAKDEPHAQLECRCSPYHTNSAFYPLAELLQRKLGWQPEDTADEKLHKLETVLAQTHLDVNTAVPLFTALLSLPLPDDRYPPIQLSSQQQRQQTLEAFLQLVLLASEQHPVLFIVEDLHWVDPSTLEFLELLIDQTPMTAIFVLFTSRPEFQPTWPHRSYLTEVSLSRLSRHQVEQMATQVASGKALPTDVIEQLVEKTDGVPLYVEEMTKSVLESGVLKEVDGQYELTGSISSLSIPATLQDSLMARLDRLVTAKGVAQYASVIGRQFSYELLQAVSDLDEGTLQRELGRLVGAELVYQRGVIPKATYLFKHALIQDTAYESLLRSTRQGYHRRIAEVLTEQFPDAAESQPELLAHHYTEAGLMEQAVGYWQRAGQQANERLAYQEAMNHLMTGLSLLQTLPETLAHQQQELLLQTSLGAAAVVVRGQSAPEVETAYMRARVLCQQLGDTQDVSPVLYGLSRFYVGLPDLPLARQLGEELLCLAERREETPLYVIAHYTLGATCMWMGELRSAHSHLEESIGHYTPAQRSSPMFWTGLDPGVGCYAYSAVALWCLGYPDQALARAHEALVLATDLAHPFSYAFALNFASATWQFRREWRDVYDHAATAVTISTEQGFPLWLAVATIFQGWALTACGKGEEGLRQMRQGLTDWRASGAELNVPCGLTLLAEGYGNLNQVEAGLDALREGQNVMKRTGEHLWKAEVHRLQGELLLHQATPDVSQAETCFQEAISIAQNQSAKSWELRAATSLARLWQSQGKRQEVYDLLTPVYGWFTEGFDTADLIDAKALLNELGG